MRVCRSHQRSYVLHFTIGWLLTTVSGERTRITAAGGFVEFGRVNGNLALSRAIGDFEFKKRADLAPEQQIVTSFPDVTVHERSDDDEFMVLACDGRFSPKFPFTFPSTAAGDHHHDDGHEELIKHHRSVGIWDCQSSQAVVEFVRRGIVAKQELQVICENLMDNCLASNGDTGGVGCDNMTLIIVGLLRGRTKEEWYEEIARRATQGDGPCAPPEYGKFAVNPHRRRRRRRHPS